MASNIDAMVERLREIRSIYSRLGGTLSGAWERAGLAYEKLDQLVMLLPALSTAGYDASGQPEEWDKPAADSERLRLMARALGGIDEIGAHVCKSFLEEAADAIDRIPSDQERAAKIRSLSVIPTGVRDRLAPSSFHPRRTATIVRETMPTPVLLVERYRWSPGAPS